MLINTCKPGTSRRNLLFIAAFVWTFAGVMLLTKGVVMMGLQTDFLLVRIIASIIGGSLFYAILFSKISNKHILRIIRLENDRPCVFSFFNFRSYIMMAVMIAMGVFLRKSGIVSPFYLSVLYVTMGIPLFVSALRFYYSGIYYRLVSVKMNF